MKTTFLQIIIFLLIGLFFFQCSETRKSESIEEQQKAAIDKKDETIAPEIIDDYMKLKEAFVDADPEKIKESAVALLEVIDATSMPEIQQNTKEIAGNDDINTQRIYFDSLSNNIYKWVKTSGKLQAPVYWQFCPMAFNNKGAYWLSKSEEVRNPYFGEKMMKCGSTKEVIEPQKN